jgi:hypothetical protein
VTIHIDTRPADDRADQIVRDAEAEMTLGELRRCPCGTAEIRPVPGSASGFVCAGCSTPLHVSQTGEVTPWAGATETRSPSSEALSGGDGSGPTALRPAHSPDDDRPTPSLNFAPLRRITGRDVRTSRVRLFLECGHAVERPYIGWQSSARCLDCLRGVAPC